MKKITIFSLFPNVFYEYINSSIIKNAINKNIVEVKIVNFRNFSKCKHKTVDDTPYGGGRGMVLKIEPIIDAIRFYKNDHTKIVLLTPSGIKYDQQKAYQLKEIDDLFLICGHYEGFDERINNYVDYQISIGDYILTGGEIPAMVVLDSIIRLYDGTIHNDSKTNESFENNLLDFPVYTKPAEFEGHKVPEILLSGNHQKIDEYRKKMQIIKTKTNRFDLYKKYLINKGAK